MMHKPTGYQICTRCVMDTSDPDIEFDDEGVCSHCYRADAIFSQYPFNLTKEEREIELKKILDKIKQDGKGKPYDCVIGLSGGVDSSYLAYLAKKKFMLRPLAIHLDNGWDSELAIRNIELLCKKLEIDLFTYVIDWEEFRDLQLSFLYASTPDTEIITDHAIVTLFTKIPAQNGINFFLSGSNMETESTSIRQWSQGHADWIYIKSIHKKFGKVPLKTYPYYDRMKLFFWKFIHPVRIIDILDYVHYNKNEAKKILKEEIGWRDYGGKHYESLFTKFYQAYILPKKFGYDKRRMHLTSLIHSRQMTREEALHELNKPLYTNEELNTDMNYVLSNLRISRNEFETIMKTPAKKYEDYPTSKTYLPYRMYDFFMKMWVDILISLSSRVFSKLKKVMKIR